MPQLQNFYEYFSPAYQEIFQKLTVGKAVASMRFDSSIKKKGDTVHRFALNLDNVRVRNVTDPYADRTIDPISDSDELLTVNYNKSANFQMSSKDILQAGDLHPMSYAGAKIAEKVAIAVDADILYETLNASFDFDAGDLTTLSSNGTPITLNSTTVPQMAQRMRAKLKYRNQQNSMNLCFVCDEYTIASIGEYLSGKQTEYSLSPFENNRVNDMKMGGAEIYASENLTAEAVLGMAANPTNGDTLTINGATITFVSTSVGTTPGNVLIAGSADATRANLAGLINNPDVTSSSQVALSAANQVLFTDALQLVATNNDTTNKLTLVARGAGRLILAETFTDGSDTWDKNFIHSYFGKKGAIDVVMQEDVDMFTREEPKKRVTNVFVEALYGIKTFADGAKKFLDVLIAA